MSSGPTFSEIVGAASSDIVPGYNLSPPSLTDIAEMQKEAARCYREEAYAHARTMNAADGQALRWQVDNAIRSGAFNWGQAGYYGWVSSVASGPFILSRLLAKRHPGLTTNQVAEIFEKAFPGIEQLAQFERMAMMVLPPPNLPTPATTPGGGQSAVPPAKPSHSTESEP